MSFKNDFLSDHIMVMTMPEKPQYTADPEDISGYQEEADYCRPDWAADDADLPADNSEYSECPFSPEDYADGEGEEEKEKSDYDQLYSVFQLFQKNKRLHSIKTAEKEELITELKALEKRNKELEEKLETAAASAKKEACHYQKIENKTIETTGNISSGNSKEGVFFTLDFNPNLKKNGLFLLTFEVAILPAVYPRLYGLLKQYGWAYNRESNSWRNSGSCHGKETVDKFMKFI